MKTGKKTPCAECPFSRKTEPGKLGGSSPKRYIGQTEGPFWLPCHMSKEYGPINKADHKRHEQCAGAAMYRDAIGTANLMPPELLRLPHDPDLVFSSHAEFLAHHERIELPLAAALLHVFPAQRCMEEEIRRLQKKVASGGDAFITPSARKT
jgi:hypothetical protein